MDCDTTTTTTTTPRRTVIHYDFGEGAFCGAKAKQLKLSPIEDEVTCRRCLARIGCQDMAESGRRWA